MTDLGLKDLINCITGLKADAATTRDVMELLGVSFQLPREEPPIRGGDDSTRSVETPQETTTQHTPERRAQPRQPPGQAVIPSELVRADDSGDQSVAQRLLHAKPLERDSMQSLDPPPFQPLLLKHWSRGVVKAALSTPDTCGIVDIHKLIEIVCRAEPVARLPFQQSPGLRRGVQLLVDRGESMSLFRRDQQWMIEQIQDIVGKPRVELLFYRDCPSGGVRRQRSVKLEPYVLPPAGTPVLLLCGLSIEAAGTVPLTSSIETWEQFADDVNKAGCPLVALVPYRRSAWPNRLRKNITCITWDERTSANSVRSLVGPWHEVDS